MTSEEQQGKDLKESEKRFLFTIIDVFAKEYGWSIEYIQKLELPEIGGLLKAIKERHDREDMIHQINTAKGFAGNISSNRQTEHKRVDSKQEIDNLHQLAEMLHIPVKEESKEK